MSEQEKRYCTGCGEEATRQCVECGEWRCAVHLHTTGGWCASTRDDRKCGEWCSRSRHRVVGDPLSCDAQTQRDQGTLCDCSTPRLVRFSYFKTDDAEPVPHWRCAAHLEESARMGWRWREETNTGPESECEASVCAVGTCRGRVRRLWSRRHANSSWEAPKRWCEQALELYRKLYPQLEWTSCKSDTASVDLWRCVVCNCDLRGGGGGPRRFDGNTIYCLHCYEKHVAEQKQVVEGSNFAFESPVSDAPVVARYYDAEKDVAFHVRDISGTPLVVRKPKAESAASPRFFVTYCSSAPPQELVERVLVRRGSGLHLGEPVMAPLVWSGPRAREWERHVAFAPNGYVQAHRLVGGGTPMTEFHPGTVVDDRDVEVPLDAIPVDQFGGRVFTGLRCRLCGGWLRQRELVR